MKTLMFAILFFTLPVIHAEFEDRHPEGITDKQWSSLKMAMQEVKLLPEPKGIGEENSHFGISVSVDGERALIGGDQLVGSGAALLFEFDGMVWHQVAMLQPGDGSAHDMFGRSVSLSGNSALVGAWRDGDNGTGSGSAYVFKYDGKNWIETQKLIASDGSAYDSFGSSVSLSGDRALVGAYGDDDNGTNSGSVYVFDYDGNVWNQSNKLNAFDYGSYDYFGISVSLSGDRALVGAIKEITGNSSGAAYIFDFDGKNWLQSQKLIAFDGAADDQFGITVSLSGNRALVGAWGDDDKGLNTGSAYVFDLNGLFWTESQKLTADDGVGNERFGHSVSLSGERVIVSAHLDDNNAIDSGSTYVFDFNGNNWISTQKIVASDGTSDDEYGISVGLSGDHMMVGAMSDDHGYASGSVYAYLFDNKDNNWKESQKLTAGDGSANDYIGYSVSISGNRVLLGAWGDDDNGSDLGSAYIFDYDGVIWIESQKLIAEGGNNFDAFGKSVSLSGDRALVGAPGVGENGISSGAVYVFDYDGMNWIQSQKFITDDGAETDYFGNSVSLSGDRALVGARGNSDNGNYSGSAYVFDYDGMSWNQSQKLIASDGQAYDEFGYTVSLSGDRSLVGAPGVDENGNDSGSAYVFEYNDLYWSQSQKLVASDGDVGDQFGKSISLSGDRVLVGASQDDDNGPNSGSAYVFDYIGTSWTQAQKLTAIDGDSEEYFGTSVSLLGNRAMVGASWDDDNGPNSGSVYVFVNHESNWGQSQKIVAVDGESNDYFGHSVSISNDRILVGAFNDNTNGTNSGSAYLYQFDLIFDNGFEMP